MCCFAIVFSTHMLLCIYKTLISITYSIRSKPATSERTMIDECTGRIEYNDCDNFSSIRVARPTKPGKLGGTVKRNKHCVYGRKFDA